MSDITRTHANPADLGKPQFRAMQRALADATDAQLVRVLSMVDAMPERGEAEQLIAPLRGRLAVLHPPRRANFVRLLFTPLDPLIVPAASWRRAMLAVPRTALRPLADTVRTMLGAICHDMEAHVARLTTDDHAALRAIGETIMPLAARALRDGGVPGDWTEATGLQAADHRPIAALAAAALRHAGEIDALVAQARTGQEPAAHDIEGLLTEAATAGAESFAVVVALLAERLPRAATLLLIADDVAARQTDTAIRAASDRAVDGILEAMEERDRSSTAVRVAAEEMRRTVGLLEDIESRSSERPTRRARIEQLRRQIDTTSRKKFTAAMDAELVGRAGTLAVATDADIADLETAARDLRRFEQTARRIGGADHYDRQLRQAAETLRPQADDAPATLADRVRLIEILQGSEVAAALVA